MPARVRFTDHAPRNIGRARSESTQPANGLLANRRQMLFGGAATAALVPLLADQVGRNGRVSFDLAPDHFRVHVDNRLMWETTLSSFDGPAGFSFERGATRIFVALRDAFFPGSTVAAFFEADLRLRAGRWLLNFSSSLAGRFEPVDLLDWLQGKKPLEKRLDRAASWRIGDRTEVTVPPSARIAWSPEWRLRLVSRDAVTLRHQAFCALSREIIVDLAGASGASAIELDWSRRAVWHFAGTRMPANYLIDVHSRQFRLAESGDASIVLESGNSAGRAYATTLLESSGTRPFAELLLENPAPSSTDAASEIPLQRFRFMEVTDTGGTAEVTVKAGTETCWVHSGGSSFLIGDPPGQDLVKLGPEVRECGAIAGSVREIALRVPGTSLAKIVVSSTVAPATNLEILQADARDADIPLDDAELFVERFADQLKLSFKFTNVSLARRSGKWSLRSRDATKESHLKVAFGPQHMLEQTFPWPALAPGAPDPVWSCDAVINQPLIADSRFSGPSALVFSLWKSDVQASNRRIDLTLRNLLDWKAYTPRLSPRAVPPNPSRAEYEAAVMANDFAGAPTDVSAIEFPTDLFLSPDANAQWQHPKDAQLVAGKATELWRTTLTTTPVRAIWATQFKIERFPKPINHGSPWPANPGKPEPFEYGAPLSEADRVGIVTYSSLFGLHAIAGQSSVETRPRTGAERTCVPETNPPPKEVTVFMPQPVQAEHLSLSMLGANAKLAVEWQPPFPIKGDCWEAPKTRKWVHRAALGRDSYVEIQDLYYAMPLGAPCVLVKITERKIARDPADRKLKAALFTRIFPAFVKPEKRFPALGHPFDGREWPMTNAVFGDVKYPNVLNPKELATHQLDPHLAATFGAGDVFWPRIDRTHPVEFEYYAVHEGGRSLVKGPLLFVGVNIVGKDKELKKALDYYNKLETFSTGPHRAPKEWREHSISGDRLTFAPSARLGDTQFETKILELRADFTADAGLVMTPALVAEDQPPFYPRVHRARVRIESIRRLSSRKLDDVDIAYDCEYVRGGFAPSINAGEIFARLKTDNVRLDVAGNTSASGGVASPNTLVVGLSRKIGLVGGEKIIECDDHPSFVPAAPRTARFGPRAATSTSSDVAMTSVREGKFDPVAYFSGALGNAKLLGVVKLADIIRAALKVIPLEAAPKLLENYVFNFDADDAAAFNQLKQKLDGVFGKLDAELQKIDSRIPGVTARLRGQLGVIRQNVRALTLPASPDPETLAAKRQKFFDDCSTIGRDALALFGELKALAKDPASLVTKAFPDLFKEVEAIRKALDKDKALELAKGLIDEQFNKKLAALVPETLRRRYDETRENIKQAQEDLKAKAEAAQDLVYSYIGEAIVQGVDLADRLEEFVRSSELSAAIVLDVRRALFTFWQISADAQAQFDAALSVLDGIIRKLPDAYTDPRIRKIAQELHSNANTLRARLIRIRDELKKASDDLRNGVPDAPKTVEEFLSLIGHQAEIVTNLRAFLPLVAQAQLASTAALGVQPGMAAAGTADQATFQTDLKSLESSIGTIAKTCSDAWDVIRKQVGADVTGKSLKVLRSKFELIRTQLTGTLPETVDRAIRNLGNVKRPLETAATPHAITDAVGNYLAEYCEIAWICGLVSRAADCFGDPVNCSAVRQIRDAYVLQLQAMVDGELATPFMNALNSGLTSLKNVAGSSYVTGNITDQLTHLEQKVVAYPGIAKVPPRARAEALREIVSRTKIVVEAIRGIFERGAIGELVDMGKLVDEAIEALPLPTRLKLSYDWKTQLGTWPEGNPIFVGKKDGKSELTLTSRTEINLLTDAKPHVTVRGHIAPFKINLLSEKTNFFTINLEEITFSSETGRGSSYDVKLGEIVLSKNFEFISKLGELLGGGEPGNGFYYRITLIPPSLEVGYGFGFDIISFGAFTIQNLRFALSFVLPFNNEPARLRFLVSERERPFLISAGIYGGGGFFGITARPDGVELLEGAFEFGAVTAIKFGPLKGQGRVTAGIYFSCGPAGGTICGYVVAFGQGRIACFGLSICLRVEVCSRPGGQVDGQASFTVTFRISKFFKVSFGFTATYAFKGGGGGRVALAAPGAFGSLAAIAAPAGHAAHASGSCDDPTSIELRPPSRKVMNDNFRKRRRSWADLDQRECRDGS
jgi:hypothetical protein